MADNLVTTTTVATLPAATRIAAREVSYSGDASSYIGPVGVVTFAGSNDAKTATDVDGGAPAENFANPTNVLGTLPFNMVFDGTTWDRQIGNSLAGTFVSVKTPNGDSAMDDTNDAIRVNVVAADSSANITDDAAFTVTTSKVVSMGGFADETGTDSVDEGDAGALRMTLDRKLIVSPQPHTAGGLSIFRSLDIDETEEEVKTTPGNLYAVWFTNTSTVTHWLKFYDGIASGVSVGTTTPVITIGLPGNTSDDVSGNLGPGGLGITFSSGITVACTTGLADNDTGAPTANAVVINCFYK